MEGKYAIEKKPVARARGIVNEVGFYLSQIQRRIYDPAEVEIRIFTLSAKRAGDLGSF